MARVITQGEAKNLGLPGRVSLEIVSREKGSQGVTLRLVEIPAPNPDQPLRGPHQHDGFEECIFVLSGEGFTEAGADRFPLKVGDTILIPAGESHVTRNTGSKPLMLLCFFPVSDINRRTHESATSPA